MSTARIEELCDVNPESVGSGSPPSWEFEYIDISSVERGIINWGQLARYRLADAPSRARRVARDGDVLLCTVRPGLKAHGHVQGRGERSTVASTGFAVLRSKLATDSGYIFHQLFSNSVAKQLRALEVGSNYPAVNERDVRNLTVHCPEPSSRSAIASVLNLIDATIEKTAAVTLKLKDLRDGLLNDLLDSGVGRVTTKPLVRSADIRFSSVDKKCSSGEKRIRLCNYTDVYNSTYITAHMPFMAATATQPEINRFGLRVGDVIITKDSETPDDIGVPAVVDEAAADLVCGYHLALIRPKLDEVDPLFLAMQLGHDRLRRYFGQQANGTTRYGLSIRAIEQAPIIDIPVEEQTRRSNVLREHDRAARAMETELTKLRMIKEGLMEDLLSGRVPVPVPSESGVLEAVQ